MRTREEKLKGGDTSDIHRRRCTKKKCFVIALIASAALMSLLIVVSICRSSDVNTVLAGAGFASLPDLAEDVMMDRQGDFLDDVRVTSIKFTASQDDIIAFLQNSGINTQGSSIDPLSMFVMEIGTSNRLSRLRSMLRGKLRSNSQVITPPYWWINDWQSPELLRHRRKSNPGNQIIIVDHETNIVYIQLWH